jgi:predicted RNase H-like nuclease (RuvC/YqgF family)
MPTRPVEKTTKRTRSNESGQKISLEDKLKRLDAKIAEGERLRKHVADHIIELAKSNHDACEKHKLERQKQAKEREERKAAKENHLNAIEAKIDVIFFGFEHIKRSAEESTNNVNENTNIVKQISDRMDTVLQENVIMRENCKAKDAEISMLHDRVNRQEEEIEVLKSMIREQARMLELYIQINERSKI